MDLDFDAYNSPLQPAKSILGKNPDASTARDRLLLSNFYRTQQSLLIFRKGLLAGTLLMTGIGVATAYVNLLDSTTDRVEPSDFFCEADFYGWLVFAFQLLFTLVATKRIIKFESEVPDSVLQVEIYQTEHNIYNEKLTVKERLASILYSVANSLVLGNLAISCYRVIFEDNRKVLVAVNAVQSLCVVISMLSGRQVMFLSHLLALLLALVVLFGGNAGCSVGILDRAVYPEVNWTDVVFPDTVFEVLQGMAFYVAAFVVSYLLSYAKNVWIEAKY